MSGPGSGPESGEVDAHAPFSAALRASWQRADDLYDGSSRVGNPGDASTSWSEQVLELSWLAREDLVLSAAIPRLEIHADQPGMPDVDLEGLGDVALLAEWWPCRGDGEEHSRSGASILLGVELPTGEEADAPASGATAPSLLQLGSGTYDPIAGLRWVGGVDRVTLFGSATVQLAGGVSDNGLRPGGVLELEAGAGTQLHERIAASAALEAVWRQHDHLNRDRLEETRSALWFATPGLSVRLGEHWTLDASVRLPLWRHVSQVQLAPGPRVSVGLAVRF